MEKSDVIFDFYCTVFVVFTNCELSLVPKHNVAQRCSQEELLSEAARKH